MRRPRPSCNIVFISFAYEKHKVVEFNRFSRGFGGIFHPGGERANERPLVKMYSLHALHVLQSGRPLFGTKR